MNGSVVLGDETTDENAAEVTIWARDDIEQYVVTGDGGVRGSGLTATAETGRVVLNAAQDEEAHSLGNAVDVAAIESAGDVLFGSNDRDTIVTVNAENGGYVMGDLKFYGVNNGFLFTNDLTVTGDALIHGAAVHGTGITAEGALEIVAVLFDESIEEGDLSGVRFTGHLEGTKVSVFTNKGDITIGSFESNDGYTDIYRLDTTSTGDVTVGGGTSSDTVTIYNGNGNVSVTGTVVGADTVYSFTGVGGSTRGEDYLVSLIHKAGAVEGAENFSDEISIGDFLELDGRDLLPGRLPHLVFTADRLEAADTNRLTPFFHPALDVNSPTSEYFFQHLRTDAASTKDEESTEEHLEEGLPAEPGNVIVDHRLPVDPMPAGWILGLR